MKKTSIIRILEKTSQELILTNAESFKIKGGIVKHPEPQNSETHACEEIHTCTTCGSTTVAVTYDIKVIATS